MCVWQSLESILPQLFAQTHQCVHSVWGPMEPLQLPKWFLSCEVSVWTSWPSSWRLVAKFHFSLTLSFKIYRFREITISFGSKESRDRIKWMIAPESRTVWAISGECLQTSLKALAATFKYNSHLELGRIKEHFRAQTYSSNRQFRFLEAKDQERNCACKYSPQSSALLISFLNNY